MTSNKFIILLSLLIGFVGTFYLAKGILWLTPNFIYQLSRTLFGGNPFIAETFVKQKADYLVGIILIFISFLFQLFLQFTHYDILLFEDFQTALIILFLVLLIIISISIFLHKIFEKINSGKVKLIWNQSK